MHDAIALANLIYALPANTTKAIEKSFAEYQKERIPHVMESFKNSQNLALFMDRGFAGSLAMFVMQKMPQWLWAIAVRPLSTFVCFSFLLAEKKKWSHELGYERG